MMTDEITQAELDVLERRVSAHDDDIMTLQRGLKRIVDDLYGDAALRSGPLTLFERIDRLEESTGERFDQLAQLIQRHDTQIQTWLGWQHLAGRVIGLLLNAALLGRFRQVLAWLLVLAGGTLLGGALFALVAAIH